MNRVYSTDGPYLGAQASRLLDFAKDTIRQQAGETPALPGKHPPSGRCSRPSAALELRVMHGNLKPPELSLRTRATNLEQMRGEIYDVAVIGGGITGAGTALDAASRGLSVALVEKRDFASGTSSRSSKLIHGGLRYLEQFHFGLVRESLQERAVLSRMAPHLSRPLEFLVPVYSSNERSPLGANRLKLAAGLWLYDLLAGRRNIARHRWLSREVALRLAPALEPDGLRGAFVYYDCLTDDARLVIEVIKAAAARGAAIANYAAARGIKANDDGSSSVQIEDVLAGRSFELRARVVVNAGGVWSDEVSRLSDVRAPQRLRPSKGIHVVTPAERFQNHAAVLIPSLGEQRFLFVIPWQGRALIGTTDTDYAGDLNEPVAEPDEVNRVIQSAARAFPSARVSTDDVISTFAGLRPLVGADNEHTTKDLSRREEIFETDSGLITVTGGKLTTWRRMAERVVDLAARRLERMGRRLPGGRRGVTDRIRLAGGSARGDATRVAAEFDVEVATVEHLMNTYGGNYGVVLELTRQSEGMKASLVRGLPHIEAEVAYATRQEMIATVEDFLARRTRITLLARDHGRACAGRVASLLGAELGWSHAEIEGAATDFAAKTGTC
ncbi:MAG TPA: glycerol-3-phosphate dehydrogenase/oxidase [Blastocatellia bacterium]|nr:glycerol-3-phosphate dehydrogenase/oxidase [Blastocatellia bacterium]